MDSTSERFCGFIETKSYQETVKSYLYFYLNWKIWKPNELIPQAKELSNNEAKKCNTQQIIAEPS